MSRIGKLAITIPEGVNVNVTEANVEVKGPKGTLNFEYNAENVKVNVVENEVVVEKTGETKFAGALWGTTRAQINNMVIGVTEGYQKGLEIQWVGYKFELQGKKLILSVGFSHKVEVEIPATLEVVADEKNKNVIYVKGFDKQAVGQFAAKIRDYKKPEPYKGKGIRYLGEYVRRKAGKTGK